MEQNYCLETMLAISWLKAVMYHQCICWCSICCGELPLWPGACGYLLTWQNKVWQQTMQESFWNLQSKGSSWVCTWSGRHWPGSLRDICFRDIISQGIVFFDRSVVLTSVMGIYPPRCLSWNLEVILGCFPPCLLHPIDFWALMPLPKHFLCRSAAFYLLS